MACVVSANDILSIFVKSNSKKRVLIVIIDKVRMYEEIMTNDDYLESNVTVTGNA